METDYVSDYDLALHSLQERRAKLDRDLKAAWRTWDLKALEACDREEAMLDAEAAELGIA